MIPEKKPLTAERMWDDLVASWHRYADILPEGEYKELHRRTAEELAELAP